MSGRGGRGRGAHYKAKYGGGRGTAHANSRANGADEAASARDSNDGVNHGNTGTSDWDSLQRDLRSIDGQPYGAYNRLRGKYQCTSPSFTLLVDHVQGDAYAPPSRVRAICQWSNTGFPDEFAESDIRRIALGDYVTRAAASYISRNYIDQSSSGTGWSGPKGGAFNINAPGQEVLPRTSAVVSNTHPNRTIELRFTVALPARGRTILGQQALSILHVKLPDLVRSVLMYQSHNKDHIARHLHAVEDQHFMRSQLQERGLVAFVANGAVLPRASGSSARPMTGQGVVPFQSPPDLEVVLKRKHGAGVRGMGIPHGVTLLTGGGFHGKSTLLEALELSVYDHIPGDGRELIVSDRTAVKVRAEDGRSVTATDISPFISNLPGGKSTKKFATDDASGSTSMAANIQEALESGCKALLIDEDSSATNLLVRDQRMQQLVRHEPITPLVSKVRALYSQHGVSTVIVIGGLGDWLSVADFVIGMESYVPRMLTSDAANIVQQLPTHVHQDSQYGALPQRNIHYPQDVLQGKPPFARRKAFVTFSSGPDPIKNPAEAEPGVDLSGLDQLVEVGQSRTIAHYLYRLAESDVQGKQLSAHLTMVEQEAAMDQCMSASLEGGDLVAVRRFEMAAAISRMRGITAS